MHVKVRKSDWRQPRGEDFARVRTLLPIAPPQSEKTPRPTAAPASSSTAPPPLPRPLQVRHQHFPPPIFFLGRGARAWPVLRPNRAPRNPLRSTGTNALSPHAALASHLPGARESLHSKPSHGSPITPPGTIPQTREGPTPRFSFVGQTGHPAAHHLP